MYDVIEECNYLVTLGLRICDYLIPLVAKEEDNSSSSSSRLGGGGGSFLKKKDLECLKCSLNSIRDLSSYGLESDRKRNWRKKLKHEASAANRLLDKFVLQVVLHRQPTLKTESQYSPHHGASTPGIVTGTHNNTLDTCAFSSIVGRDEDVSIVRDRLLSTVQGISILGETGVGSTTVARLVYRDDKIVQRFGDRRLWINVSHDCDISRILIQILESLTGTLLGRGLNHETLLTKLRQLLLGKEYLFVLDDVDDVNTAKEADLLWFLINEISRSMGSIFLTTSEYSAVREVSMKSTYRLPYHHLQTLSHEDSCTLFRTRASDGKPRRAPDSDVFYREALSGYRGCRGLPVLINLFAGLMHKLPARDWFELQYHEKVSSPQCQTVFKLKLCFESSSSFLNQGKKCFAYCSLFPKDYDIDKDNLIQLWMSQGYLQPFLRYKLEMEDEGEDYFNFFCRSSFFQDIKFDECYNVTSCKMHDMVHHLAILLSQGNCFTWPFSDEQYSGHNIQHLSVCNGLKRWPIYLKEVIGGLKTLFVTGNLPKNIGDAKYLRTISVNQEAVRELPSSLSKCIHLTYLDISRTSIETFPDFITKLINLQTLRLPDPTYFKELPQDFYKLVNLRHFYYRYPVNSGNVRLVPIMLGCLTSLRTLPFFVVGEDTGRKIEELGSLPKLIGHLKIFNLEKVRNKDEAVKANLSGKSKILALKLCWSYIREEGKNNDGDVLEWLQPCRDLKRLEIIHFRGERLALWMNRRSNLVSIKLWYCTECKQIPKLGHLPNLEVVELSGFHILEHIGPEFYGDRFIINHDFGDTSASETARASATIFPALRKLTLVDMPNLVEWSDIQGTEEFFPKLETITIMGCPSLVTIPCHLLSFQEVFIHSTDSIIRNDSRDFKKTYQPFLAVGVDPDSKFDILLQDILRKSSESLRNLKLLKLDKLSCLSNNLQNLSSLTNIEVSECHNLSYLVNEIPDGFCSLTSLNTLKIKQCPRLESCWGKSLHSLTNLRTLEIGGFSEELEYFPWPSSKAPVDPLVLLETLSLRGWPKLQSLPDQLQNLTALRNLSIVQFDGLKALSEWMSNLFSLQSLWIQQCENLRTLPSLEAMQQLTTLDSLYICKCSILEERCQRGSGEEWHKIEHIPSVNIYPFTPDIGDEELDLS